MKIKVEKGQQIMCPHCGVVLAECPKDFELNYNHSFEGSLFRLGFIYHTIDWLSGSNKVECMECGNKFNVFNCVSDALKS